MSVKRVSIAWVRAIVATAEACGVDRAKLFDAVQLAPETIEGALGFVPLAKTVEIWSAAEKLSGDPHFGLKMGARVRPGYLSIVAYAMMSCGNFTEALLQAQRYQRLISEGGKLELRLEEPLASIVYWPQTDELAFSRHQIEAVLVVIIGFGRWLVSQELSPVEVRFTHPEPAETAEHRRVFGCPVVFGATENSIVLDRSWLEKPLPESDPQLHRTHAAQADRRLSEMDAQNVPEQIAAILEGSGHFHGTRGHMAHRLGLSRRTLQRRLAETGTTFRVLVDAYRHRAAAALLADPEISISEVGFLIGFAEPSTFYRAFKRWEGIPPAQYRRERAGTPRGD